MAEDGKTPPTHPQGGAGTLCVHVVSLCADTITMTCRPCWDTHILTYQQTDSQTHRHTYINQYKHIVIPIHGCICVTYPPFGGGGGGGEPGGAGSYICGILLKMMDENIFELPGWSSLNDGIKCNIASCRQLTLAIVKEDKHHKPPMLGVPCYFLGGASL